MTRRRTSVFALVSALVLAMLSPAAFSNAAVDDLVLDTFSRTVDRGWGSAEVGGRWILDTQENARVTDGTGDLVIPAGGKRTAYIPQDIEGPHEASATFTFPAVPTAGSGLRAGMTLLRQGESYFLASVRVAQGGYVLLSLSAVSAPFLDSRLTFEKYVGSIADGGSVTVKASVTDSPAPIVQAKAWTSGESEPADWQVAGASTAVPSAGYAGFIFDASESTPVTAVRVNELRVAQGSADNAPPTASFTQKLQRLVLTVDASASTDPDGEIATYLWDFGDGSTSVGAQPEPHLYREAGTYTVTLTVTDDAGAAATATEEVVIEPIRFPDAETTGVPEGTQLKLLSTTARPYPGDTMSSTKLTIKTPGAVYDGWRFDRLVEVRARGVEIRNSSFEGINGNPSNSALLQVYNDRVEGQIPSVEVEDSTLIPKYPNDTIDGVRGSNFTLRRVEITKTVDGMQIYGAAGDYEDPYAGNVLVEKSWIHDLIWYDNDSHADGTHNDAAQVSGGRNITFLGNRIDGTIYNAVMYASQPRNRVADITFLGNYMSGGSCSLNIYDGHKPGQPMLGVVVALNVFDKGSTTNPDCPMIISDGTRAITTARANIWHDLSEPGPNIRNGARSAGWAWSEVYERWLRVNPNEPEPTPEPTPEPPAPSEEQTRQFVSQAYEDVLGRPADTGGLDSWTASLVEGRLSRTGFMTSLAYSYEASANAVRAIYSDVLGRAPDPSGLQNWASAISQQRLKVKDARMNIWASAERQAKSGSVEQWVRDLYGSELGRAVDPSGLASWSQVVRDQGPIAAARGIIGSKEWAKGQVSDLYQTMLGRAPDASGLDSWTTRLMQTDIPPVIISLGASQEYYDRAS